MSTQEAADLRATADVLERDGWTQNAYHAVRDGKVCHCVQGALAVAITGDQWANPGDAREDDFPTSRWDRANATLVALVGYNTADWNDSRHRTADYVIETLREAAKVAERSEP